MKMLFLTGCLLISVLAANGQIRYEFDSTIPVKAEDQIFADAWAGGLNAAQYNTIDLDGDGDEDLAIYDRMAQKVLTFIRDSDRYRYAPDFERLFPAAIYNWMLIRDFDCDGKKDIFTGHIFGISVYRNVSEANQLEWKLFPFYDGNATSEVVLTEGLSGRINLQIQFDDLPAIGDADGDGDLDIFVMNYGGSGMVQFHKNFSQERFGKCDSLDFELADPWWGGVRECDCDEFAFDNTECNTGGRPNHAGGKSLTLMDADGDGFQDLLIAEGECNILNMLDNNGPADAPVIADAPHFPPGAEAFNLYPTGYYEDLDFDGVKDFVVSANIFSKSEYNINLRESNWLYKNTGTNESPVLARVTKSFLQGSMIDLGDHVVPAFADMDADGDLDMFLSNNELPATITVFRNTGNVFEPSFEMHEDDYLGLSNYAYSMMKIQFADLDGDGKTDLLFTATDSSTGVTGVYYLLNRRENALDFEGKVPVRLDFIVARGDNVSFIHVGNDGAIDILKGKSNGAVEYWRNAGSMQFLLDQSEFLGVGPNIQSTRAAFASADLDANGKLDLIVGDETGRITIISDFRGASDMEGSAKDVVWSSAIEDYYAPNLGGRIWPTTANLYGSDRPLVIVGTILGGVRVLRSTGDESSGPVIGLYPNPVAPTTQQLNVRSNRDVTLTIYSAAGQLVQNAIFIPAKNPLVMPLTGWAAGVYIFKFYEGKKSYVRRLVVR